MEKLFKGYLLFGKKSDVHGNERKKYSWTYRHRIVSNVAFLTDLSDHLNKLNIKLQGQKQITTADVYDCTKACKCELMLWVMLSNANFVVSMQLSIGILVDFMSLQSLRNHRGWKNIQIYVWVYMQSFVVDYKNFGFRKEVCFFAKWKSTNLHCGQDWQMIIFSRF